MECEAQSAATSEENLLDPLRHAGCDWYCRCAWTEWTCNGYFHSSFCYRCYLLYLQPWPVWSPSVNYRQHEYPLVVMTLYHNITYDNEALKALEAYNLSIALTEFSSEQD